MNSREPIDRDRLSVIAGATLLALALARFLDAPIRPFSVNAFGSPLGINLSATTLMLLLITGLAVTGVEGLIRSHPLARQGKIGRTFIHWFVPGVLALALAGWLSRVENLGVWTVALLGSSLLLPVALAAEYAAVLPENRQAALLQWSHSALIHLVAVLAFALVFEWRARSLLSGTAVVLLATLLAVRLFWPQANRPADALVYGAAVGLILGQLTWVLNYWRLSSLRGGLLLLLAFYVTAGLIQQFMLGRFNRQVVWEYSGVAVVALLVVLVAVQ
jgi:hypothetical protein